jgi:hypothetical protein
MGRSRCAIAAMAMLLVTGAAKAQTPGGPSPALANDRIIIAYSEPAASHFRPLALRLKEWRYLEQLKEFLSPLKLPSGVQLKITMKECGSVNSWWSGRRFGLFLCYEFFDYAERAAPLDMTETGVPRGNAILGAMLQVTFHELGHALFDIFDVPVMGREEDAADQISGFILTQFGPAIALQTLPGAVHLWRSFAEVEPEWRRTAYADEHGHPLQRAYNYLCLAYGSDPATFQHIVDAGLLPKARAGHCGREYRQVLNAFARTMLPHIDQEKMQLVMQRRWLTPEGSAPPP